MIFLVVAANNLQSSIEATKALILESCPLTLFSPNLKLQLTDNNCNSWADTVLKTLNVSSSQATAKNASLLEIIVDYYIYRRCVYLVTVKQVTGAINPLILIITLPEIISTKIRFEGHIKWYYVAQTLERFPEGRVHYLSC